MISGLSLKLNFKSRKTLFFMALVIGLSWQVLAHCGRAYADTNVTISNQLPVANSADVFSDKTPIRAGTPSLTVGLNSFDGNYSWAKVYVPVGTPANITIQNGGGLCVGVNDSTDNAVFGPIPDVNYTLEDLDANENEVSGVGSYFQAMNNLSAGTSCRDLSFPTIPADAGTSSRLYGHGGFRVFYLVVHIVNCPDTNTTCVGDTEKSYRIRTDNGLVGFSRALRAQFNVNKPFGVNYHNLGRTDGNNANFTYNFQFAPRCNETLDPNAVITTYDADNGLFDPQYLSGDLYENDKSIIGLSWALQQHYTADELGAPGVNHARGTLGFSANPQFGYKFYMRQVNYDNAVQFYTDYDQFDANENYVKCFDSTCTITPTSATQTVGRPVAVSVTTHNSGVAPWPSSYVLGQIEPLGPTYPLSTAVLPNRDAVFSFNVTRGSPGNYTLVYQMGSGSGSWFGEQCTITLTFVASGNQPLTVDCKNVTVREISPSAGVPNVPTRLVFTSSQTFTHDFTMSNDPDQVKIFDTFKDFPFQLLPHESYNVRLYSQDDSSGSYNLQGTATLPVCFSASCNGFTPDFEPGQTKDDIQTSIVLDNKTNQTFPLRQPGSTSGYHLRLDASGGITVRNESSTPANIIRSSQTLIDHMNLTIDYKGTLTLDLYYDTGPTNLTSLPCVHTYSPSTRPFFQVWGGDISTGGGFNDSNGNCPSTYPGYVSPATAPSNDSNYAGIKAFSDPVGGSVSSADFGAIALGLIASKPSSFVGFVTRNTFANSGAFPAGSSGGYLNSVSSAHCVTDFYDTTQSSPLSVGVPNNVSSLSGSATGQYIVGNSINNFKGGTIGSGTQIALYVDGNVIISGDISYGNWNRDNPSSAPFFAIFAKGDIVLTNNVQRLDGLYVAQVNNSGSGGDFRTCDNFCNQQLIVNGAVVAQHIELLRSFGTLATDSSVVSKPAEIFNYIPSMVYGSSILNPLPNTTQNLISLPPVFQ
jgi:hypothetical protein